MATNTNVTVVDLMPVGGPLSGYKIGYIDSGAKAAQNDTWTVTNASVIMLAHVSDDSAGTLDACTISSNVITLTDTKAIEKVRDILLKDSTYVKRENKINIQKELEQGKEIIEKHFK